MIRRAILDGQGCGAITVAGVGKPSSVDNEEIHYVIADVHPKSPRTHHHLELEASERFRTALKLKKHRFGDSVAIQKANIQ